MHVGETFKKTIDPVKEFVGKLWKEMD